MHVDHVGGLADLTAQTPKPLLPNATLIAAEAEWDFIHSNDLYSALPLPGHTPGQMGLRISDGSDSLLV